MTVRQPPGRWVERWLSAWRFGIYLTEAAGDRQLALDLYGWNAAMSAAVLHDLAHLEVAIRTADNGALEAHQPRSPALDDRSWTLLPIQTLGGRQRDAERAQRQAATLGPRRHPQCRGASAPTGKVLAELMFGFWRYLTTRNHDGTLWVPYLRHAFPVGMAGAGPARFNRAAVDRAMGELHTLRNRVAHHEPLLSAHLAARRADLVLLLDFIDTDLSAHVQRQSTWAVIETQRP